MTLLVRAPSDSLAMASASSATAPPPFATFLLPLVPLRFTLRVCCSSSILIFLLDPLICNSTQQQQQQRAQRRQSSGTATVSRSDGTAPAQRSVVGTVRPLSLHHSSCL